MNIKHLLFVLGIGATSIFIGGCDSGNNNTAADMAVAPGRDLSTGPDLATTPADMAMPGCVDPATQNPTHAQILNTCTNAQKIDKTPKLPPAPCM